MSPLLITGCKDTYHIPNVMDSIHRAQVDRWSANSLISDGKDTQKSPYPQGYRQFIG